MNNLLTKLFLKYQDYPSFFSSNPITSVHDLGSMGETLLNLAVNSQAKKDVILLIENGAKTNIKNEFGYDAKHYATEEYHDKKKSKEIMNLLRNYK